MVDFCKSRVPADVRDAIEAVKDSDKDVKALGLKLGVAMSRRLLAEGCRHPGLAAPRFSQNHSVSRSYPAGLRRSPRGTLLLIPTPRRWTGRALTGHGDMHFSASPGGYSGLSVQQPGLRWMRTTADTSDRPRPAARRQ